MACFDAADASDASDAKKCKTTTSSLSFADIADLFISPAYARGGGGHGSAGHPAAGHTGEAGHPAETAPHATEGEGTRTGTGRSTTEEGSGITTWWPFRTWFGPHSSTPATQCDKDKQTPDGKCSDQ